MQKTLLAQCDELDIIYCAKDGFVFSNFDSSSIRKYIELITFENDASIPDCKADWKLIFKQKGKQLFAAEISTEKSKGSINCNAVRYKLDSKEYKHLLTYQVGMGIDNIYWHRYSPEKDSWIGIDTTKFHYEELKNNP